MFSLVTGRSVKRTKRLLESHEREEKAARIIQKFFRRHSHDPPYVRPQMVSLIVPPTNELKEDAFKKLKEEKEKMEEKIKLFEKEMEEKRKLFEKEMEEKKEQFNTWKLTSVTMTQERERKRLNEEWGALALQRERFQQASKHHVALFNKCVEKRNVMWNKQVADVGKRANEIVTLLNSPLSKEKVVYPHLDFNEMNK
jgi:hypothetical protein